MFRTYTCSHLLDSQHDGLAANRLPEPLYTVARRVAPYFIDVDSTPLVDRQFSGLQYASQQNADRMQERTMNQVVLTKEEER
jgi:hypothetical protein